MSSNSIPYRMHQINNTDCSFLLNLVLEYASSLSNSDLVEYQQILDFICYLSNNNNIDKECCTIEEESTDGVPLSEDNQPSSISSSNNNNLVHECCLKLDVVDFVQSYLLQQQQQATVVVQPFPLDRIVFNQPLPPLGDIPTYNQEEDHDHLSRYQTFQPSNSYTITNTTTTSIVADSSEDNKIDEALGFVLNTADNQIGSFSSLKRSRSESRSTINLLNDESSLKHKRMLGNENVHKVSRQKKSSKSNSNSHQSSMQFKFNQWMFHSVKQ